MLWHWPNSLRNLFVKISFLDTIWWIVRLPSTKIIYSSSFGEMVRMGTGSGQIVPDFISRKTLRKKHSTTAEKGHFLMCSFLLVWQLISYFKCVQLRGIRFRSAIKTFSSAEKFYWITLSNCDLCLWTAQSKSFLMTEMLALVKKSMRNVWWLNFITEAIDTQLDSKPSKQF